MSGQNHCYFIRNFGCQMNVHDSEHIAGVLENAGYERADSVEQSGLLIFNTCCVRQSAEDRVWGNLGALNLTEGNRGRIVAVCGCMAQRHGVEILRRSPVANLVFGMDALSRLPELIEESRRSPVCDLGDVSHATIDCLPAIRGSKAQAWVPVSHGCDNRCAYCVVPMVRGAQRSRAMSDIVDEVERLVGQGAREIILLGQNVNSYGRDLETTVSFAGLLDAVASVEGIRRVKFETSHPRDLTHEVLEVMAREPHICEYLHLPVQSGSDRVLAAMNRGYGRDYCFELIARARKTVPELTVTTDIITGFPGETEDDFADTLELLREVEFDSAYLFIYSEREGTPASLLGGNVSIEEKHRRFDKLARLQEGITARSLEKIVGHDVEVLIEGFSKRGGFLAGRARGHQVVLLSGDRPNGCLARANIHEAGKRTLRGKVVEVLDGQTVDRLERFEPC